VISGPLFANTTQEITFGVGHGCAGADTSSVRVEIPPEVASVRTLTSDFGRATVETNTAGFVTAVTWQKPAAELLPADSAYYKLTLRVKVPNAPFTTLRFPAHQTCKGASGEDIVVDWVSATSTGPDGGEAEPAPTALVLPARKPGWNKFVLPIEITDLSSFFGDALIVWRANSAYAPSQATSDLVKTTAGVTALTNLVVGDEIWVKY
jgi:uncharacterized protein YcnI